MIYIYTTLQGYTFQDEITGIIAENVIDNICGFYLWNFDNLNKGTYFHWVYYEDLYDDTVPYLQALMSFIGYEDIDISVAEAAVRYSSMEAMKEREKKRSLKQDDKISKKGYKADGLITPNITNPNAYKSRKGGAGGYLTEFHSKTIDIINKRLAWKVKGIHTPLWKYYNGTAVYPQTGPRCVWVWYYIHII